MTQLFPMVQAPEERAAENSLPLYRECAYDFATGRPILELGSPKIVTGKEAIKVWAWKACKTARAKFEIYGWDFGGEFEELIGRAYTEDIKQSEARRYVRECLLVNPYITGVEDIEVGFDRGTLTISARLETVYGEETIYV